MIQVFQGLKTEEYLQMFGDSFEYVETDNYVVAIYPNEFDDFRFFTYVNGIHLRKGGTHIYYLVDDMLVPRLRDKLMKKHKTIKPGDIKNKLRVVVMMKNIKSKFEAQTKLELEIGKDELRDYFDAIDFDKFVQKVVKNDNIINPITEIFELKELRKLQNEMKGKDKEPKKIKYEKFTAPSHEWKRLMICEGESASKGLMPSLGRKENGYFELKGVPMNVIGTSVQTIIKNQELNGLKDVIGLKWSEDVTDIRFDEIVIATDQDLDGFHIRGLLYAFFYRFAPSLLKDGRIKILSTPLMLLKKGDKVIKTYFDFDEFDNKDVKPGYKVKYLKGIGSWTPKEFDQVVDMYTLDGLIETYEWDDDAEEILIHWLSDKNVDVRKEYLSQNDFNINDM